MDVLYISHASAMLPFEDVPLRSFFKSLSTTVIKERPKAILMISGHWETAEPTVSTTSKNSTIYDFDGIPEAHQLKYDAPGAPEVAKRTIELLTEAGFKQAREDPERGLDHGAWVPLWISYPRADIPIFQLSVQPEHDGLYHYNLGKALAPLTKDNVLIIGSGTTTHNLGELTDHVPDWAKAFDDWLHDCLTNQRYDEVAQFMEKAPHAKINHPTPDHFLPLIVALGAAGDGAKAEAVHRSFMWSFSMASYLFKPAYS